MTQTTQQLNQLPNKPQLKDLLALFRKDLLIGLNCHHVGRIESFDPDTQLAQASIAYKKTRFVEAGEGEYVPILEDYPVLVDCPVVSLGGGDGCLTFPYAKGDECLILFNDR